MSANSLTQAVIRLLTLRGFLAWRANQIPVRGRIFVGLRGVPDVIAIAPQFIGADGGQFWGVEVKVGRDEQSEAQIAFEREAKKRGAVYIVARSLDDVIRELDRRAS